MGDGVTVDLHALTTFAHEVGKVADEVQPDVKGLGTDMANNSMDIIKGGMKSMVAEGNELTGHVGHADFSESSSFARYHSVVALSGVQFVADVLKGVIALGSGAEFCAINYANTDAFNATTLAGIDAKGGMAGQNFVMSGTANITGDQVNGAFAPKDGKSLWQPPTGSAPVDPNAVGTPTDPKTGKPINPDTQFQGNVDQQRTDIAQGKVPDLPPGHEPAPDGTDMPFPNDIPESGQTGNTGVSV